MYADDLVRWLMTIAENSSTDCSIYNVGSSEPILIRDLAHKIGSYFGVKVIVPTALFDSEVDRYIPSIKKAESIGLTIKYDLEMALSQTIETIKKLNTWT